MAAFFLGVVSLRLVNRELEVFGIGNIILQVIAMSILYGGILGYIAGVLVGGAFLVADVVRKKLLNSSSDDATKTAIASASPSPSHPANNPMPRTP
jgi:hypothetical protein